MKWAAGAAAVMAMVLVIPMLAVMSMMRATNLACRTTSAPAASGTVTTLLAAIRQHESGGNYRAQNPTSTASGAYQFLDSTWQSEAAAAGQAVTARAMDAPPAEQDAVAAFMATAALNGPAHGDVLKVADIWYIGHVASPAELDIAPAGNGGLTPRMYEQQIATLIGQQNQPAGGTGGYVNPVDPTWLAARTDQGVDWIPPTPTPVIALGDAMVTFSSSSTGWPGGAFITYRLTDGPHAGDYIYVAEHLVDLVPLGTQVVAGQQIATALPGYPWLEMGYAAAQGDSPASPYNGAADGTPTAGGQAFNRLLRELGAKPLQDFGVGPDRPDGSASGAGLVSQPCGSPAGAGIAGGIGFYPGDAAEPAQMRLFYQDRVTYGVNANVVVLMLDPHSTDVTVANMWGHFEQPGAWNAAPQPRPTMVISTPLAFGANSPNPIVSAQYLTATISGAHDDVYQRLARDLVAAGYPDAIVRLGWEFDGDWWPWEAVDHPDLYAQAFRHVALLMRATAPRLRFDWCGAAFQPHDMTAAYPGDDVVDIVGMDIYDIGRDVAPALAPRAAFAAAHGKPDSYAEWGDFTKGDNPVFVQQMAAWFAGLGGRLAYQSYFLSGAGGAMSLSDAPRSRAVYEQMIHS